MLKLRNLSRIYRTPEIETTALREVMVTHSHAHAEYAHRVINLLDRSVVSEKAREIA